MHKSGIPIDVFLIITPAFYLNAFGVLKDTQTINPNDCFVSPANTVLFGDRKENAPEHGSTSHLYIWERK